MDKSSPKNQPNQIILALNLTTLTFNDMLTIDYFRLNSTVNDDLISAKLDHILDHRITGV